MPNRRSAEAPGRGADPASTSDVVAPSGLPAGLEDLPWELPHTFLGLDEKAAAFQSASACTTSALALSLTRSSAILVWSTLLSSSAVFRLEV